MISDVQTIDIFERLRAALLEAHPAALDSLEPPVESDAPPQRRVLEAWVQTVAGRGAITAAERRRLRALVRAIHEGREQELDHPTAEEARVLGWSSKARTALDQAGVRNLWPLGKKRPPPSAADLAKGWERLLPGLTRLRSWQMIDLLGRSVLLPDRAVRRFLWRLGLLEQLPEEPVADEMIVSLGDRIAQLTGMSGRVVNLLVRWHTGDEARFRGGGTCGVQPKCALCPVRSRCAWARYRYRADEPEPAPLKRRTRSEPLVGQIAADYQSTMKEIELLAVVLHGCGDGLELAETLLRRFGSLKGIEQTSVAELAQVRGLSRARAAQVKAALELGRRLAAQGMAPGDPIGCSADVWNAYRSRFQHLPQEHFAVLLLDSKNRVMHDHIVSKGTLNGAMVHPRDVFKPAIRHSAAGVILMHNHPSGDPTPSAEDRAVTDRLREAGEVLGIRVLDHIILGAEDYYSFSDDA